MPVGRRSIRLLLLLHSSSSGRSGAWNRRTPQTGGLVGVYLPYLVAAVTPQLNGANEAGNPAAHDSGHGGNKRVGGTKNGGKSRVEFVHFIQ